MNLKSQPAFLKLILFGLLIMLSVMLMAGMMFLINPGLTTNLSINQMKLTQAINQLMIFVVPTLVFSWLVSSGPKKYFNLHFRVDGQHVMNTVIFLVLMLPLIGYTSYLNQQMQLPPFLEGVEAWMRQMEDQMAEVTEKIAFANTIPQLLVNLLVMAVIPAVGEELFFRGFLQKYFHAWFKNVHVTVWVVAFLFSAFHVQFYGFIPRFLMGAALGYTFVWTRNMWMPILFHFLNNAVAVVSYYYYSTGKMETKPEEVGTMTNMWGVIVLVVVIVFFCRWFYQNRVKDTDWPAQMGEL